MITMVDGAAFFGLGLVGWKLYGWAGVAGTLVLAATLWNFARALLFLIGGAFVSLFVTFPMAAVLSVWQPYLEDEALQDEMADALA